MTEARQPLSGATLRLVREQNNDGVYVESGGTGDRYTTRSDHSGAYALPGVLCGTYVLVVTHPDRRMSFEVPVDVTSDGGDFDVDVPLGIVEGYVRDPEGRPLKGISVSVSAFDGLRGDGESLRGLDAPCSARRLVSGGSGREMSGPSSRYGIM